MIRVAVTNFDEWRQTARQLLTEGREPYLVDWHSSEQGQKNLFAGEVLSPSIVSNIPIRISPDFVELARRISCHRDPEKWSLLYLALWRLVKEEKHLLRLSTDPLVHRLRQMDAQVRRDSHKAKAFVRFRLLEEEGEEHYIAWHRPDHKILPLVAPFFKRRFSVMRWTICTPDESVAWDGEKLQFGPGIPAVDVTHEDKFEDVWRVYYRATFNPARIKIKMMKQEMPVRHWATLPEARIIPELLAKAQTRVQKMIDTQEGDRETAAHYLPQEFSYPALKSAAAHCRGCNLYCNATQTVFGEGPLDARIMLVGEQPGDEEDLQGRVFVGPAGQLLNGIVEKAGMTRQDFYITNAVKHFRFIHKPERREHQAPDSRNIIACKPWLQTEIRLIRPHVIVALGVTAGRSLIHHGFALKHDQQKDLKFEDIPVIPTWHPSAALRAPRAELKREIMEHIEKSLRRAAFVERERMHAG